jgi:hypothetical protein
LLALSLAACTHETSPDVGSADDHFTSAQATLLDFEFDGELYASSNQNLAGKVRAQLMYTVGHLNAQRSGPRLNAVQLSNLSATPASGGLYRIRYHAKLPVAWASKTTFPTSYKITLPMRIDQAGLAMFSSKYGETCTEHDGHQLTAANIWYYYRPATAGCSFASGDVSVSTATVKKSALNAVNKYPEYHRIWEDGSLDVVAVFGKTEKGATSADAGIDAYDDFVATMRSLFPNAKTTPASLPAAPGVAFPDVTIEADTSAGHVSIVVLLVDEVSSAPASFVARFSEATPRADLVLYGGHAGLGANVRALTQQAKWFPAKYQLLFLDGCDTFSYEDDSLNAARKLLNPSDPSGTKYLDVMRNAMPAYFHSLSGALAAIVDSIVDRGSPRSYQQIFEQIDAAQVVLVTAEEDNTFTPAFNPGPRWQGLAKSGSVGYKQAQSYETEQLAAGQYAFELTPDPSLPGGDADLYLRVGQAPTATSTYKCPSYKFNSNERCLVTLGQPAKVYLQTMGDKKTMLSPYRLRGWQMYP